MCYTHFCGGNMMKKFVKILAAVSIALYTVNTLPVIASTQSAKELVEQAVNQKSFYYFNQAYASILELKDEVQREQLLAKLAAISSTVWNDEVKNVNKIIDELAKTASGKIYDDIQVVINKSKLPEVDKSYFLGEVTSWGKRLVWTEDYSNAVSSLSTAWTKKDSDSISKAEKAIGNIKSKINKEYLLGDLNNLKSSVIIIKSKLVPTGVTATAISTSEITIQWNPVDGADYYYVYTNDSATGTFECLRNDDGSKKQIDWHSDYSAKLSKLEGNTTKHIKVTSVKDGVESEFSALISATTNSPDIEYYPLLPDVPRPDFFVYDMVEYTDNNTVISYMYPLAKIPLNFITSYNELFIKNGWKASGTETISGDMIYYYKKNDKTVWLRVYTERKYIGIGGKM